MILVEGPDGAGKSTLVAELCRRFDLRQGTRSTTDRDLLHETTVVDTYAALTAEVIDRMAGDPPVVWDRLFYSDPVYAHVVRNEESRFSIPQQQYIHDMICALGCPVILCMPPLETVVENVRSGGHQLDGVSENIEEIYSVYAELHDSGLFPRRHPLYVYDYTIRGSVPRMGTRVREYIRHRKELACRAS